jgi:GNAT superfamily N-acetyltransferase
MTVSVSSYDASDEDAIVALSLRAWAPVFPLMKAAVADYVYAAFYPNGWQQRQAKDVRDFLRSRDQTTFVARQGESVLGFVGTRFHPDDSRGEIVIIAVEPKHQGKGIAKVLMQGASDHLRDQGASILMVETGDDPGHVPSRAAYEAFGFERWPVARYFKPLS